MQDHENNQEQIVCRAILVNEDGDVLLGKRVRGGGIGKWALVGGKPEGMENPDEAIVREVAEELGVRFKPRFFRKYEDQQSPDRAEGEADSWQVIVYVGTFSGEPTLKTEEISEIAYVNPENISQYDIAFNHKYILEKYFASLDSE